MSIIRKLKVHFDAIPTGILNFITVISGLITILVPVITKGIPFLLTLLGFNVQNIGIIHFLYLHGTSLYSGFVTIFAVLITIKVFRYRKVQMETRRVISSSYYQFLHDFRNTVGDFKVSQQKKDLSLTLLSTVAKDMCVKTLNGLCEIFEVLCSDKVSACIKLVNKTDDENNTFVVTFARSSNSASHRVVNDEETCKNYIKDNTDFRDIIDYKMPYFYQKDLLKYKEELEKERKEYKNTTPNWEKHYRSTIVVPIRIANKRSHITTRENNYLIMGFLCIDSMSTNIFIPSQEKYYCHILKSYASLLYTFFGLYKELLKEVREDKSLPNVNTKGKNNNGIQKTSVKEEKSTNHFDGSNRKKRNRNRNIKKGQ